jgi:hypothetical protein
LVSALFSFWSEAFTASFEEVKNILTTAPVMAYPRDEGGYILDTDACDDTDILQERGILTYHQHCHACCQVDVG